MSLCYFYLFFLIIDLGESIIKEKVIVLKEKVVRWFILFCCSSVKRYWEKMEEDFNVFILLE